MALWRKGYRPQVGGAKSLRRTQMGVSAVVSSGKATLYLRLSPRREENMRQAGRPASHGVCKRETRRRVSAEIVRLFSAS